MTIRVEDVQPTISVVEARNDGGFPVDNGEADQVIINKQDKTGSLDLTPIVVGTVAALLLIVIFICVMFFRRRISDRHKSVMGDIRKASMYPPATARYDHLLCCLLSMQALF